MITLLSCAKIAEVVYHVDQSSCDACGKCVQTCPYDAIEFVNGKAVIDQTKCKQCGECIEVCPKGAVY